MLDAVLSGEGLARVAALAADAAGAPVAIVVPRLGARVASPGAEAGLAVVPDGVTAEVPIASGDERIGGVLLLGGEPGPEAVEFLHLAAVAALTEIAVEEAREEVEENVRGSFLEALRAGGELDAAEVVRRAGR